jgi:ATP-dependent DNA ligase
MQRSATNKLRSLPAKQASFVEPMECLSVARLPEGSQWLWQIKLDGYRPEFEVKNIHYISFVPSEALG